MVARLRRWVVGLILAEDLVFEPVRILSRLIAGLFAVTLASLVIGLAGAAPIISFPINPLLAAPVADTPPAVAYVAPAHNTAAVGLDAVLEVVFNEPVGFTGTPFELVCTRSGWHALTIDGGDTAFTLLPDPPFLPQDTCVATVLAAAVSDRDTDDPPNLMTADYTWTFITGDGPARQVVINELDAAVDEVSQTFIELYDGGGGNAGLGGLVIVVYDSEATVAAAIDLGGQVTDAAGYYVLDSAGLSAGGLPSGPAAVALYAGSVAAFPQGAAATLDGLIDAVVYSTGQSAGADLLALLFEDEPVVDENGRGQATTDAIGRCPNGSGGQRRTQNFSPISPSPGEANHCPVDQAPAVSAVSPLPDQPHVAYDAAIEVTFSEPVKLDEGALEIECTLSGSHAHTLAGDETSFVATPLDPFQPSEVCVVFIHAERVHDTDEADPPDIMLAAYTWQFTTRRAVADFVVINEVDADTPGTDTGEFVELFDGGAGHTSLDGLALVFFNGGDQLSYNTISLEGYATDENGYFLIGNGGVAGVDIVFADGLLQNGPDAVALFASDGLSLADGAPVTVAAPVDALVYGLAGQPAGDLLVLLNPGQEAVDENARGEREAHSSQRCPNGQGGPRNTTSYWQNPPTAGSVNNCLTDYAPRIASVSPDSGESGVSIHANLVIKFSEPVNVDSDWLSISCSASGIHSFTREGGPEQFTIITKRPFAFDEDCLATIRSQFVRDKDDDDPPDQMDADYSWHFQTMEPVADFIVINEIDANTPGSDTAEFIELYDGGRGSTNLNGMVLVFFNGGSQSSYRTIDLSGWTTDQRGYLLIGNPAVNPEITFPNGQLQNGPDAVALYAGLISDFPNDSPVRLDGLIDAVVYGDPSTVPAGLLKLLQAGEEAIDEGSRGAAEEHSLQRCPNGSGGQRRTVSFLANTPTPREASNCITDLAPTVKSVSPADGVGGISRYSLLSVQFSEAVRLSTGWFSLTCSATGNHKISTTGGPELYVLEPEKSFALQEQCTARIHAVAVNDMDTDDPPDQMAEDYTWGFQTIDQVADFIVINELDSDTAASDDAEFIELFDGGRGNTDLTGLIVVLFNGNGDEAYHLIDLHGSKTDRNGYFVIGNRKITNRQEELPDGILQNGADAIALYEGEPSVFRIGASPTVKGLIDAVVYGTSDPPDPELLVLLNPGQQQVDENGRGAAEAHSLQRCPNGSGGKRNTSSFLANTPTPGRPSFCHIDVGPRVEWVSPNDGAVEVVTDSPLSVRFSEDVALDAGWVSLYCSTSGQHQLTIAGGPRSFSLTSPESFHSGETCLAIIHGAKVHDLDTDDPPDMLAEDFSWQFSVKITPVANFVMINEIDSDTPGADRAEFIELFDGGRGHTPLDELVLVFWNGKGDIVYHRLDLAGYTTDAEGYFLAANPGVSGAAVTFPNASLQNGPDAVALYSGRGSDFPTGLPLTKKNLIDAVVYGLSDRPDGGLLGLLDAGQFQVDENARLMGDVDSLQRCPDGAGGLRQTAAYRAGTPTPGAPNVCLADEAPTIVEMFPMADASGVPLQVEIRLTFSEDVWVNDGWIALDCTLSGSKHLNTAGGPRIFTAIPVAPLVPDESCMVTLHAVHIGDIDADDPPDTLAGDFSWRFHTQPPAPGEVVAAFTHNGPLWIGQTAVFNNISQGPGPMTFTWDFGDGGPWVYEQDPVHEYTNPGRYVVKLIAAHGAILNTYQAEIEVRARQIYLPVSSGGP
jgi:hypothetical protein